MGRQLPGKGILTRLREAQSTKDWGEVSCILDEATGSDANAITPIMTELVTHHNWLVRASAVEVVGVFRQGQFVDLVQARLRDTNKVVRSHALQAYYDLLGAQSLPTLKSFCGDKNVGIRVTALALCYAATKDDSLLRTLKGILLREYCRYNDRYAALHTLDYYLDISTDPDVMQMFRSILKVTPRSLGLAKDLRKKLKEWENRQRPSRDRSS
jgi:hypothetical protein